jgi:dienelactone hydrolase
MKIVTYSSGAANIRAEWYSPLARASRPASVIIAHGSDGVTDHLNGPWATKMRSMAEALTLQGLTVVIPYYFEKTGTEPGVPAMQSMFGHIADWQVALTDSMAVAGGTPVALIGFSLGGHLSLRLRGTVAAVVEYFAPLLTGFGSPSNGTRTPVQVHHGKADGLVDVANADKIVELLREEGSAVDVYRYPSAGHGFGGAKPGDSKAWKLSLSRTVKFVSSHLLGY